LLASHLSDPSGTEIVISTHAEMEEMVMPLICQKKSNRAHKFPAFQRQLNNFGFRKVCGKERKNKTLAYRNDLFTRLQPKLLHSIIRKANTSASADGRPTKRLRKAPRESASLPPAECTAGTGAGAGTAAAAAAAAATAAAAARQRQRQQRGSGSGSSTAGSVTRTLLSSLLHVFKSILGVFDHALALYQVISCFVPGHDHALGAFNCD
jgi:hypothetical protein